MHVSNTLVGAASAKIRDTVSGQFRWETLFPPLKSLPGETTMRRKKFLTELLPVVAAAVITVFFVPRAKAQAESTLYSFTGAGDGGNPLSSLVMDGAGNLYGTTFVGGAYGAGAVYELTHGSNG